MRFNFNKTVLVLSTIGLFASGIASATSNNNCNMTTGCGSWGDAKIYNMYDDLGHNYSTGINLNGITVNVSA